MLFTEYHEHIDFSAPIQNHVFLLRCMPQSRLGQRVFDAHLAVEPCDERFEHGDSFGNLCIFGRAARAHSSFDIKASARIESCYEGGIREEPWSVFLCETPLTRASQAMRGFLSGAVKEFMSDGAIRKGAARDAFSALCSAVHDAMSYEPGSSGIKTAASDAFAARRGVCQDFAHIFISFARVLKFHARYVCGATVGEGATHAWAEVFIPENSRAADARGRKWVGFDPTRNKICDNTYAVFSKGRDFSDCQIDRGVFTGYAAQTLSVFVKTVSCGDAAARLQEPAQ